MSLKRLDKLSNNVLNMVIHCPSPSLQYFIRGKIRDKIHTHRDYIVQIEKVADLKKAKIDSNIQPLLCDKWLIHVDAEKIGKKDVQASLERHSMNGVIIYWTSNYRTFKELEDLDVVKKQGVYCPVLSYSLLGETDVEYLHGEIIPERRKMQKELLNYVAKNYRFDVQAVMDLFNLIRSGNEMETKKDIIEAVGVGGNTVDNLTVKLLQCQPKDEKALATRYKSFIKLIDDLSIKYPHRTIKNYMFNTLEGLIEIKQLQVLGVYNRVGKELPELFDTKKIQRVKRFEKIILEQITLPTLLNLKMCLQHYTDFNAEIALMQVVSDFLHSNMKSKVG